MASGDPPVTGNPAVAGTISFVAKPGTDNDHMLRVQLDRKNAHLKITIDKKDGSNPVIVTVPADKWSLLLEEIP